MVRILTIQHEDDADARRFGDWLIEAGATLEVLRPDQGDEVPADLSGFDGLLVLGGSSGPQDDDTHPWLSGTRALQQRAVADDVPAFNICLGGELAAVAFGSSVRRRVTPQVGVYELRRRPEADGDPVFGALPEGARAVLWHQEEITQIPPGAVHLIEGTDAPIQAFRVGSVCWATQFHPEPDAEIVRSWAESTSLTAGAGRSVEELLAEYVREERAIEEAFRPVAAAFVQVARARAAGRST